MIEKQQKEVIFTNQELSPKTHSNEVVLFFFIQLYYVLGACVTDLCKKKIILLNSNGYTRRKISLECSF